MMRSTGHVHFLHIRHQQQMTVLCPHQSVLSFYCCTEGGLGGASMLDTVLQCVCVHVIVGAPEVGMSQVLLK